MKQIRPIQFLFSAAIGVAGFGCANSPPEGPPVQVVDVPSARPPAVDPVKPMPDPRDHPPAGPAFDDPAVVHQEIPGTQDFVRQYTAAGRPRLMVFVNRTLTGDLIPVNPDSPDLTIENIRQSTGPAHVADSSTTFGNTNTRTYESTSAAKFSDAYKIYLKPGQYDQAQANTIDYELIENLLADDLSADGAVILISPLSARQRLTDAEVAELQNGRPQMLGEIAGKLQSDVLIQVTARPSVQTEQGLGIRLVAQAMFTKTGQAIALAAVDVPPPLTKTTMNVYVRFVAQKLMDGMAHTWANQSSPAPAPVRPAVTKPVVPVKPFPIVPTSRPLNLPDPP